MSTIEERVHKLIRQNLNISADKVVSSARIVEDLDADSLDVIELIMATEEEFEVEIPDEDAENINTVQDLCEYVVNLTKGSTESTTVGL